MRTFQITLPFNHTDEDIESAVRQFLGTTESFRIIKRSIDARSHREIKVHYTITTELSDPVKTILEQLKTQREKIKTRNIKPIVVGSGPGGIFCAYWLALHGLKPILLEQGPRMRQRILDMALFMKKGILKPHSNICMGAGGAGTYSDGKLITRIRSPYIPLVMKTFVEFGAPENIRYLYNPHLGSNKIRQCITALLHHLEELGVEVKYETEFTDFTVRSDSTVISNVTSRGAIKDCSALFLAIGHSSRTTYAMLRRNGVAMEVKPYAMGVRVEHSARCINEIQYGKNYEQHYQNIETAQFKLAHTWDIDERAVYSFCMCPGGFVLNASTDEHGIVTNGMSNYAKSGRFSNAAIVVNVSEKDLQREGYSGIDGGIEFQKTLEDIFRSTVNKTGSHIVPAQKLLDFLSDRKTESIGKHSCACPAASAEIHKLFPKFILDALKSGFDIFERSMKTFSTNPDTQIFGIESRTSSPYRIVRDPHTLTSLSHPNLYPIGEGAGYAGGITSAAVDGIKAAQAFIEKII